MYILCTGKARAHVEEDHAPLLLRDAAHLLPLGLAANDTFKIMQHNNDCLRYCKQRMCKLSFTANV